MNLLRRAPSRVSKTIARMCIVQALQTQIEHSHLDEKRTRPNAEHRWYSEIRIAVKNDDFYGRAEPHASLPRFSFRRSVFARDRFRLRLRNLFVYLSAGVPRRKRIARITCSLRKCSGLPRSRSFGVSKRMFRVEKRRDRRKLDVRGSITDRPGNSEEDLDGGDTRREGRIWKENGTLRVVA